MGIGEVGIAIAITETAFKFVYWLKKRKTKIREKNEKSEALFDFLKNAVVTVGNANPWVEGEVHPDDREALGLFKSWTLTHLREDQEIKYIPSIIGSPFDTKNLNKNICSIGGPASNLFTRYGMGYDPKGKSWINILPFIYPLKEAEERAKKKGVTVLRERLGQQWESPNWYIAQSNGKPVYLPSLKGKTLLDDYFMIIVAPNVFTEEAFFTGKKHMMIASAHGVSELAVKEILEDEDILENLQKLNRETGYYQAIIKIPRIDYIASKRGYFPAGKPFFLPRSTPLESDDFRKLENFEKWLNF